ncbi:uncharacterized protein LOC110979683 isoform X2 [Acanthaster planci]|uniref:Uncharacterized protein LOC110979683 isoform X2 n=1 Tax=Acanthaster planci TaxID=133434 RepID=A0A8B7YID6_ACAPL|nr:uncharacterized protein LOC110979683 isoform X2 [Acanthaster planci]
MSMRWAVLEQSADRESVTLRLFRSEKEACEKQAYTLGRENFIGTERGSVKQYNKKTPALYWAIITVHDQTLLFQDSHNSNKTVSTFEKWDKILKDFWNHQSWMVTPLKGPNSFVKERGLTLHLNRASVCFAYLNPPRHYCRLYLDTIEQVFYDGTRLCFNVTKDTSNGDYYEVKTERERFACRIKEGIENLRTQCLGIVSSNPIKTVSPQERPASISPIDNTTGENIHMDINSLMNKNQINCQLKSPVAGSCPIALGKATDSKGMTVPMIKIIPVGVVAEDSKPETGRGQNALPVIPPRTTSCANSTGPAVRSDASWTDCAVSSSKLQKGISASTGKLHVLEGDHAWEDPSVAEKGPPVPTPRRKVPENGVRVTSAVQLPLPKPPVPTSPTTNDKPGWPRQDDFDSIGDSMSSIASSELISMDITQSSSSLSSDEERGRSSSTESRKKSPIRTSVISLNGCSSTQAKVPGYSRSFSVPTELPHNHHFVDTGRIDPDYKSMEQEYINVSKDSLTSPKVIDDDDDDGENLYLNVAHDKSIYVNPSLNPSVNPIPIPPRHPQPPSTSRTSRPEYSSPKSCDSMELHELLDAMLQGDEQGSTMGLPLSVWLKFCLNCDMDRSNYGANNWKGLAEQLGLSSSDIILIDDYSRRYSKKPTQVILSYWERQANPLRPFNKTELISMLHELERQDLLDIVIQREKYTGTK